MTTELVKWQSGGAVASIQTIRDIAHVESAFGVIERSFPGEIDSSARAKKAHALLEQACVHIACSEVAANILRCTRESILQSLADCASVNLSLQKAMGEAYLVPYGAACTLMPGYRGLITLMVRTGAVWSVDTNAVYEGETFEPELGSVPRVRHIPRMDVHRDWSHMVGVYAVARMANGPDTIELMNMEELLRIKKCVKAVNGPSKWWPEEWARKTVVRRLSKRFPKRGDDVTTEILAHAYELDNAHFDLQRNQADETLREHGRSLRAVAEREMIEGQVVEPAEPPPAEPPATTGDEPVTTADKRALIAHVKTKIAESGASDAMAAADLIAEALRKGMGLPGLTKRADLDTVRELFDGGRVDYATGDVLPE